MRLPWNMLQRDAQPHGAVLEPEGEGAVAGAPLGTDAAIAGAGSPSARA